MGRTDFRRFLGDETKESEREKKKKIPKRGAVLDFLGKYMYNNRNNESRKGDPTVKNQTELTLRLPEDLLRKLIYVSEAEGRSPNNHILMLLRNSVQYFERTKGKIPPSALQAIDLSAPTSDED